MKVARDIYPHDAIGDHYYIAAVAPWNQKAAADPKVKVLIEGGIEQLNAAAMAAHAVSYSQVGWEEERVALLRSIEKSNFLKYYARISWSHSTTNTISGQSSVTRAHPQKRVAISSADLATSTGSRRFEREEKLWLNSIRTTTGS